MNAFELHGLDLFGPEHTKKLKALPPGTYNSKYAPGWFGEDYRRSEKAFNSRISRKSKSKSNN